MADDIKTEGQTERSTRTIINPRNGQEIVVDDVDWADHVAKTRAKMQSMRRMGLSGDDAIYKLMRDDLMARKPFAVARGVDPQLFDTFVEFYLDPSYPGRLNGLSRTSDGLAAELISTYRRLHPEASRSDLDRETQIIREEVVVMHKMQNEAMSTARTSLSSNISAKNEDLRLSKLLAFEHTRGNPLKRHTVSIQDYVAFSSTLWDASIKVAPETAKQTSFERLQTHCALANGPAVNVRENLIMSGLMQTTVGQFIIASQLRWKDCGHPYIEVEETYAALLMATTAKPEVYAHILAPWPCFFILLPRGWFHSKTSDGTRTELRYVHVLYDTTFPDSVGTDSEKRWSFFVTGEDSGAELMNFHCTTETLVKISNMETFDGDISKTDTDDDRTLMMIGRLIQGICLSLSNPNTLREIPAPKRPKGFNAVQWARKHPKHLQAHGYIVGEPVKIDCRAEIKEYLSGRRSGGPVSVRSIVRAHWKNQPCGPKKLQRKRIIVDAYERGPKDAPLKIKAHQIAGDKAPA